MPSVIRERMQKLMDEQKAEATLPTSRAVMDFGEQEIDEPEQQEADTEPMDLPEQAPDEEVPASDESSADAGDDAVAEMDVPDREEQEPKDEPEWQELLTQFEPPEMEEQQPDPYAEAMADTEWRMALQERSQMLT